LHLFTFTSHSFNSFPLEIIYPAFSLIPFPFPAFFVYSPFIALLAFFFSLFSLICSFSFIFRHLSFSLKSRMCFYFGFIFLFWFYFQYLFLFSIFHFQFLIFNSSPFLFSPFAS